MSAVQNAEVVTASTTSSKPRLVQMAHSEEAKRAVQELHDKDFLGRKLVERCETSEHARRTDDLSRRTETRWYGPPSPGFCFEGGDPLWEKKCGLAPSH